MRPIFFWLPLFALVGLAVVMPAWQHFLGTLSSLPAHVQFLAALVPPTLVALLGASWLQPGGS